MIRLVDKSDASSLVHLLNQLTDEKANTKKVTQVIDKMINNEAYEIFGLFSHDGLVASATLIKGIDITGDGRDFYILENFIVDRNHQGKGYGHSLLDFIENLVIARNGRSLLFTSSSSRTNAHDFYYHHGYEKNAVKGFKKYFKKSE